MNKQTQIFLNFFLKGEIIPLDVDGYLGEKSNRAIQLAITKLQKLFAKRKWEWDSKFNFIGLRTDDDFDNRFDDFFVFYAYGTIIACEASTVSGMQGVMAGPNKWYKGVNGTLVIAADQQINYMFVDPKDPKETFGNKNWSGGCFLFQDRDFHYFRDANGNNIIDYGTPYYGGAWEIGGNVHSWENCYGELVSSLSEGCQVTRWYWWSQIEDLFRKHHANKRIIYSLIKY